MVFKSIIGVTCACLAIVSFSANSALLERLDGLAYYDDTLDITWLRDPKYAETSGYDGDGLMTWDVANTWVAGLNIDGVTGWRLPTMLDTGTPGCNFSYNGTDCGYNVQTGSATTTVYSEMASLWTDTLGFLPLYDTEGNLQDSGRDGGPNGPFYPMEGKYWLGVEYATILDWAWTFDLLFDSAYQHRTEKVTELHAWAVHDGDVGAVPIPAAIWLFGSGLIGLIGIARRKKA